MAYPQGELPRTASKRSSQDYPSTHSGELGQEEGGPEASPRPSAPSDSLAPSGSLRRVLRRRSHGTIARKTRLIGELGEPLVRHTRNLDEVASCVQPPTGVIHL
jgi:hypothetical protein